MPRKFAIAGPCHSAGSMYANPLAPCFSALQYATSSPSVSASALSSAVSACCSAIGRLAFDRRGCHSHGAPSELVARGVVGDEERTGTDRVVVAVAVGVAVGRTLRRARCARAADRTAAELLELVVAGVVAAEELGHVFGTLLTAGDTGTE